jgi:hypothetical protein
MSHTCWHCDGQIDNRQDVVLLRDGLSICKACIRRLHVASDVPQTGTCRFCLRPIGGREGFLWHKRRSAVLSRHGEVICEGCLTLLKNIVAEEWDEDRQRAP